MSKLKVNKSEIIREYLKTHGDIGPTDLAKLIHDERNVQCTVQDVSNVKRRLAQQSEAGQQESHPQPSRGSYQTVRAASSPAEIPPPVIPRQTGHVTLSDHLIKLREVTSVFGKQETKVLLDLLDVE